MNIVINIDEDTYMNIIKSEYTEHGFIFDDDKEVAIHAIKNGTPLPEHHGDLIDRQALIDNGIEKGFCNWYDEIKYANPVIEAEGSDEE